MIKTKTKDDPKATKAPIAGSFNELQNKLRSKVNEQYQPDPLRNQGRLYVSDVVPTSPVTAGDAIVENWDEDKHYKVPFTVDALNLIQLGESVEVEEQRSYIPKSAKGLIVAKDDKQRLITAPVLLPGVPDCDACRGEDPLTVEKIQSIAHAYLKDYRIVDKMHDFFSTKEDVAEPVESWLLREPTVMKTISGDELTLPIGTWVATTHITDDDTWNKVEKGEYTGYSVTALSKDVAEELAAAKGLDLDGFAKKERVLIKDLTDPVGFTISLVPKPCVEQAVFCSVKDYMGDNDKSEKAGRRFSNSTVDKINKVFDSLKSGFEEVQNILMAAENERQIDSSNKSDLEVLDMNEKDVQKMIDDKFEEGLKAQPDLQKENDDLKKQVADLQAQVDELKKGAGKEDSTDDVKDKVEKEDPDKVDEIPEAVKTQLEELKEENASIKSQLEKLGVKPESKSEKGQDGDDPNPAVKSTYELMGRDAAGNKIQK